MSDIGHDGEIMEMETDFEPLSNDMPEEFIPESDAGRYSAAERVLSIATIILSSLLLLGSIVFWCYFVRRLSICPVAMTNRELYPPLLVCCAAITLAFTIAQVMRKRSMCPETWLTNICFSGIVTTVIMTLFNCVTLGKPFEWVDLLTTACFSVSGCALPAAVWFVLWAAVLLFIDHIRLENSKDRKKVYADVRSQNEGRF